MPKKQIKPPKDIARIGKLLEQANDEGTLWSEDGFPADIILPNGEKLHIVALRDEYLIFEFDGKFWGCPYDTTSWGDYTDFVNIEEVSLQKEVIEVWKPVKK